MAQFQITIVRPEGYPHSSCFREAAETVEYGLRECGHAVRRSENAFDPQAMNIIFGAHLLTAQQANLLPPGSIIYNLEQIGGPALAPDYYALALRHRIWDYSPVNIETWRGLSCAFPPALVEVGYVPELSRIPRRPEQDIDVLFYGSLNGRRNQVLDKLRAAGVKIHSVCGVYGEERDDLIARSKLVLNVHYYDTQIFEIVRVSYLLANRKAVVTEASPDLDGLRAAVAAFPYESLAEGCIALLGNKHERNTLESRGFEMFSARSEARILSRVISGGPCPPRTQPLKKLNLGSGRDWREDCLNADRNAYWRPDAVLDFSKPLPFGHEIETERFGAIRLEEGSFDEIIASHVLEHIADLPTAMTSCLRLLKPGGLFKIEVPYDLSYGAWQDPTHVRAFNERSWLYYTDWFWYLEWTRARFDLVHIEFILSDLGKELKQKLEGMDLVRQPRAVDAMRVTLLKRLLTEQEKQFVTGYWKRPTARRITPAPGGLGLP